MNLDIASVESCKSVIVLASCNPGAADDEKAGSDNVVIKTILAVIASLPDDSDVPIVAEIFHDRNRQVVADAIRLQRIEGEHDRTAPIKVVGRRRERLRIGEHLILNND